MKLDDLTDKQRSILGRLTPCSDAVREIKSKIALIQNAREFTDEYKAEKINEVLEKQKEKYSKTLNEVIEELELVAKVKIKWEEKSDAGMLYDLMLFKEYLGTGNVKSVCDLVSSNSTNKTYRQLFELNYDKMLDTLIAKNDRNAAHILYETKMALDNLGVDQDIEYILTNLKAIKNSKLLYNGLDVMDGVVTKPVVNVNGVNVGKLE